MGLVRFTGMLVHFTSDITRVRAPVTSCMAHMLQVCVSTFLVHGVMSYVAEDIAIGGVMDGWVMGWMDVET